MNKIEQLEEQLREARKEAAMESRKDIIKRIEQGNAFYEDRDSGAFYKINGIVDKYTNIVFKVDILNDSYIEANETQHYFGEPIEDLSLEWNAHLDTLIEKAKSLKV